MNDRWLPESICARTKVRFLPIAMIVTVYRYRATPATAAELVTIFI